jgi:4-amino-4-deoxychorismate lyase
MHRFIETIRLENGHLSNLDYHQARMNHAFREFFHGQPVIDINYFLSTCPMPNVGLHKVRIVYDTEVQSVQISSYKIKEIKTLRIVNGDSISYSHKFEDRGELEKLFDLRQNSEDIIVVKDGELTDASFANLTFKKADRWFTPSNFLLNGTMRQQLLDKGLIEEATILVEDLGNYEKVKLINAMLLFDGPEIDVSQIVE